MQFKHHRVQHTYDQILKQARLITLLVLQHALVLFLLASDINGSDRSVHLGVVIFLLGAC